MYVYIQYVYVSDEEAAYYNIKHYARFLLSGWSSVRESRKRQEGGYILES